MQSNNKVETIFLGPDETQQGIFDWGLYRIGYFIMKCHDKEGSNEDSSLMIEGREKLLLAISDGAGGHPRGDLASQVVVENLKNHFQAEDYFSVLESVESANQAVLDLKLGAKATLCFCLISEDTIQMASVGDSEFIGWNQKGKNRYSNIPDSQVGYSIEAGHMTQEQSLDDPERFYVHNMMGDKILRIESSSKISTKKGHTFVMGSDGLFDNFSHERLYSLIGQGGFEESFDELCKLCRDQAELQKLDDISFFVIRKVSTSS